MIWARLRLAPPALNPIRRRWMTQRPAQPEKNAEKNVVILPPRPPLDVDAGLSVTWCFLGFANSGRNLRLDFSGFGRICFSEVPFSPGKRAKSRAAPEGTRYGTSYASFRR